MFPKRRFSDIVEGVTSKTFLLTPFAGLIPSFLCMTSALNIYVTQFTIYKYLMDSITNCTFYYIAFLKTNT